MWALMRKEACDFDIARTVYCVTANESAHSKLGKECVHIAVVGREDVPFYLRRAIKESAFAIGETPQTCKQKPAEGRYLQ
jgi:hypothetical protein